MGTIGTAQVENHIGIVFLNDSAVVPAYGIVGENYVIVFKRADFNDILVEEELLSLLRSGVHNELRAANMDCFWIAVNVGDLGWLCLIGILLMGRHECSTLAKREVDLSSQRDISFEGSLVFPFGKTGSGNEVVLRREIVHNTEAR